jgi:hypothetical protein
MSRPEAAIKLIPQTLEAWKAGGERSYSLHGFPKRICPCGREVEQGCEPPVADAALLREEAVHSPDDPMFARPPAHIYR